MTSGSERYELRRPSTDGSPKGYNGLFGLVKTGLKRDPLSGELFLFVNKRRKRARC